MRSKDSMAQPGDEQGRNVPRNGYSIRTGPRSERAWCVEEQKGGQ